MKRILFVILFLWVIAANIPVFCAEVSNKELLYLKDGSVVECDTIWIDTQNIVRCRKDNKYSIYEVDLDKTFVEQKTGEERKYEEKHPSRKFGLGASVSYMKYSGDEITLYGVRVETKADDTFTFGMNFSYFFNEHLSLELSEDYIKTDVDFEALGYSLNMGELKQIPLLLTCRYNLSTNTNLRPFLGAGVGYYFNSFDTNTYNAALIYGPGAKISLDNKFGYHINGGIEYVIEETYGLSFDLKYLWNRADGEVNIPGFTKEEMKMDAFIVGIHINYFF